MTFRDLFLPLAALVLSVGIACRSPQAIERGALVSAHELEQVGDSSVKSAGALGSGDLIESKGYLKNPQVSVLLRESNSKKVFVFGEVQKPGTFAYDDNMSIIQAITIAGGFTKTAAKNNASVTRLVAGQEKKIRVAVEDIGVGREPNFLLKPGDIIFVPESFF